MWVHFVPETEWSAKVPEQHLLVLTLADGGHDHAVHYRLILLALSRGCVFLQGRIIIIMIIINTININSSSSSCNLIVVIVKVVVVIVAYKNSLMK